MRSCDRRLIAFCSAALITATAPLLFASGAEEDAKTFFATGRELRLAGNCADAVLSFRRALEVYPEGLGALRNIAECEETLGLFATARRDWWDLRRAALQSNEPRYSSWSTDAEAHYKALAAKVGTMKIEIEGGEGNPGIRVIMDGKPLDPRLIGVALERDSGAHTVEVFYGGAAPVTRKIDLAIGANQVVKLAIPSSTAPGAPKGTPVGPSTAPSGPRTRTLRTAGFIGLGLSGAGIVGTAVALGIRAGALSDIEDRCASVGDGYSCPPDLEGRYDTGKTASMLANVFAGVAIVGLGVGITLLIVDGSNAAPPSAAAGPSAALSFFAMPDGAGSRFLVKF